MTKLDGDIKWGFAIIVSDVHIGARCDQDFGGSVLSLLGRVPESGASGRLSGIDACPMTE